MRQEILLSGSGGQGIITASIILGEAAAIHSGYNVVQSQAYGPEARGGSSSAHVIISDKEVGYPKVVNPHVVVCLTQQAMERFGPKLRPGGVMITDRFFVRRIGPLDARLYNLRMYERVQMEIGMPIVFNICMLGALIGLTKVVEPDAVEHVLEGRIKPKYLDANRKAFRLGLEIARGARIWRADLPEVAGQRVLTSPDVPQG